MIWFFFPRFPPLDCFWWNVVTGTPELNWKRYIIEKKNRHNQLKVCFANRNIKFTILLIFFFLLSFFIFSVTLPSVRISLPFFLLPPCTRLDSWPLYSTWLLWVHGFKHPKNTLAMHASLGVVARHEKINC